jgi:hypothetical protein
LIWKAKGRGRFRPFLEKEARNKKGFGTFIKPERRMGRRHFDNKTFEKSIRKEHSRRTFQKNVREEHSKRTFEERKESLTGFETYPRFYKKN